MGNCRYAANLLSTYRRYVAVVDPEPGGKLDELRPFLNINPEDFPLIVAWLLAALRPRGPYPILVPTGVTGTGKTAFSNLLLQLVDPNSAEVQPPPRDLDDFYVAALNRHCLGFDNISRLSLPMSDAFCRMATGAGNVRRKFHTRHEQTRYPKMARPQILNGIAEFVTQPDLQSRALIINLEQKLDMSSMQNLKSCALAFLALY